MTEVSKGTLLGLALMLAMVGVILVIFGAIYTVNNSTYYGTPIWSAPPVPPEHFPLSLNFISGNYTLNYLGVTLLVIAAALVFAITKLREPLAHPPQTPSDNAVGRVGRSRP